MGMEDGRRGTFVVGYCGSLLRISVDLKLIPCVVYAQGGRPFFQNPPQLRREMRDFGKSNGKDKCKGMENGRHGTFIVEESGPLLPIFVDLS